MGIFCDIIIRKKAGYAHKARYEIEVFYENVGKYLPVLCLNDICDKVKHYSTL